MFETFAIRGRAIVARCPKTKRLDWFPRRMTETSGGLTITWTECRQCWHGDGDIHSYVKDRTAPAKSGS